MTTPLSTEKVNSILANWQNGTYGFNKLKAAFHRLSINLRKSNILFDYTNEEILEQIKCANDPIYFVEKYCMIRTDEGYRNIVLRGYQKDYILAVIGSRVTLAHTSRQLGISTCNAAIITYLSTFFTDKMTMIISSYLPESKNLLHIVKTMYERLPYFIKPGVKHFRDNDVKFDNGSRIKVTSATLHSAVGFNLDNLFILDAGSTRIKEDWINSIVPAINARCESRMVVNGNRVGTKSVLYKMMQNIPDATKITLDYTPAPNRDELWKDEMIENLGSSEIFDNEYCCKIN